MSFSFNIFKTNFSLRFYALQIEHVFYEYYEISIPAVDFNKSIKYIFDCLPKNNISSMMLTLEISHSIHEYSINNTLSLGNCGGDFLFL